MGGYSYPGTFVGRRLPRNEFSTPFGNASVDRSQGLAGSDWLRSQSDSQAAALDPAGTAPFASGDGILFSGAGTLADLEGRGNARKLIEEAYGHPALEERMREAEVTKAEQLAQDPYGLGAYRAKEEIRRSVPTPKDIRAEDTLRQQEEEAQKLQQIEADGLAAGYTPKQVQKAVRNYIEKESLRRSFATGKYDTSARLLNPLG